MLYEETRDRANANTDRKLFNFAGNLHINIVAKDWSEKVEKTIEPWIYEATGELTSFFSLDLIRN
jgi:hypothetical protein